jgi:hypothetical protein
MLFSLVARRGSFSLISFSIEARIFLSHGVRVTLLLLPYL